MRKFLHDSIDWIFKQSALITSLALLALSIIDISNIDDWKIQLLVITSFPIGKIIYYFAVIIALIFGYISFKNDKDIKILELDNQEKGRKIIDLENALSDSIKEMNELFDSYLTLMIKNLNFKYTERISVYKVFEDKFVLIGRASDNPNFQLVGRNSYPKNDGFIGLGWATGEFFINDLPDPTVRNGETYFNAVNAVCQIEKKVVQSIKMKSRTYLVLRIKGYDNQAKAVLVIESINKEGFDKDAVLQKLEDAKQPLVMFVEKNNGVKLQPTNNLGL
jgi:hypothetical protein